MIEVKIDTPLHEIALFDPTIITVFHRFGIELGLSNNTVESICKEKELDMDFFLAIINTYLSPTYFPKNKIVNFCASDIVNYLSQTNLFYEKYQIPNIERHFGLLLKKTEAGNSNLNLMMNFFVEVKTELLQRINDDRNNWFPQLLHQYSMFNGGSNIPFNSEMEEDGDPIEDKIDDLISMFVIHLKGSYDHNLCQAVLISLANFKKDITQNNRIRTRILKPFSQALKGE